jgi:hypothetical protein
MFGGKLLYHWRKFVLQLTLSRIQAMTAETDRSTIGAD